MSTSLCFTKDIFSSAPHGKRSDLQHLGEKENLKKANVSFFCEIVFIVLRSVTSHRYWQVKRFFFPFCAVKKNKVQCIGLKKFCMSLTLLFYIWVILFVPPLILQNCCVGENPTSAQLIYIVQCRTCNTNIRWLQKSMSHLDGTVNNAYTELSSNQSFILCCMVLSPCLFTLKLIKRRWTCTHNASLCSDC